MKTPRKKDESLIPPGSYCYVFVKKPNEKTGRPFTILACPYWDYKKDKPGRRRGYCHYLETGDWEEDGTFLLWDMCKECGLRHEIDDIEVDILSHSDDEKEEKIYLSEIIIWAEKVLSYVEDEEHKQKVLKWLEELQDRAKKLKL